MMSTKKKINKIRVAVAWGCGVLALSDVMAADSTVPYYWNVAPMTNGAYREAFEVLPNWANKAGNVLSNLSPTVTGVSRSNTWFVAGAKVLQLDTAGTVVTNTLSYTNETAVSYATRPVYVDMKVRFDALSDEPDAALLASSKLAVYVSSDLKLVVAHNTGCASNTIIDAAGLTNNWHQLTVRITNGTFNVFLDDQPVGVDYTPKGAGTPNQLDAASFWGTGFIDDLYVSHGDPKYAVAGPTNTIPVLPSAGSNPPTDEQQTRINVWLCGQNEVTSLGTMTQDQLSQAYLVAATLATPTATAPDILFGISAIDVLSTTQVRVTAALKVGSQDKAGLINGRIRLQGKVNINDGWTVLTEAVTVSAANFSNGKATYTFTIPSGYQFFQPQIIP